MKRGFTKTELVVALLVIVVLLACLGSFVPIHFLLLMMFGWIGYLARVVPQMQLDGSAIATFALAILLFTGGFHALASSLYGRNAIATEASKEPRWHWRWSLSIVGMVLVLFVAGISMVGITHQIAWLATADGPLFQLPTARSRMESSNNLKQIVISVHSYHDEHQSLPPGMRAGRRGEALHSWQTLILPYMEQQALYKTIDLARPWTDAANRRQMETVVQVYLLQRGRDRSDRVNADGYALSHYAANVHVLGGAAEINWSKITDGMSNTILAGEAAGNYKPWGHPHNWRDPASGINMSPDGFGSPWHAGGANFAMADGSVRFVKDDIDPAVLRALATPHGNEKLPDDY